METNFDIVVIGSGPGGYTAAIRAAQLGYKTAIIEKYDVLGGTCTNVGCIPSKAMLDSTEQYHHILHKTKKSGIEVSTPQLNFTTLVDRNRNVVKQNTDGIQYLMKKNKIQVITGTASFINAQTLTVKDTKITGKYFIIATGSKPSSLPGINFDKKRILSSTEILYLQEKPKSLVIVGGGVIGVEMAAVFSRIGTEVTILEYADRLIPTMDKELGTELQKLMTKEGVKIVTGAKVQSAINEGQQVKVDYGTTLEADYCLIATGRKPYTTGLGLENTKVKLDDKGRITVNASLQTAEQHIYAIGDVIQGPMLAHKAEDEAVAVIEGIHGKPHAVNYLRIPGVVYTSPEVASVGYTEEQLKEQGINYNKGKFPFIASGRARASDDTAGFVKVLSDPKYGEVLGVHIIGARAADLIAQAVMAMEFELTDIELGKISYAHPTFSEALKEAYLQASGRGSLNL